MTVKIDELRARARGWRRSGYSCCHDLTVDQFAALLDELEMLRKERDEAVSLLREALPELNGRYPDPMASQIKLSLRIRMALGGKKERDEALAELERVK